MTEQSRPWIQTAFGGRVHIPGFLESVDPTEFSIADIAYALAGQSRFNGNLRIKYSVAQHSVWVAERLMKANRGWDICLYGLLHDGHEFAVGDLVTPIKMSMPPDAREWYKSTTVKFDRAIFKMAGLDPDMPDWIADLVAKADHEALCREAVLGMRGGPRTDWRLDVQMKRTLQDQAAWDPLKELTIDQAAEQFLATYAMLQDMRSGPVEGGEHDLTN